MRFGVAILGIMPVLIGAGATAGQCVPDWSVITPHVAVNPLAVWDRDGPGPEGPVLVGAQFLPAAPGQFGTSRVHWYDGRAWRSLGPPFISRASSSAVVGAMTVSVASGVASPEPGLYAGGRFDEVGIEPTYNIARWDGKCWRGVGGGAGGYGLGGYVSSLYMFDEDGAGPGEANLFIGGRFVEVAGIWDPGLVRWDGSAYSEVGGGLAGYGHGYFARVLDMIEFDDDGPGSRIPALYVAGSFAYAGGVGANSIARWDGSNWEALGIGLTWYISGSVRALAVFDADGPGPEPAMLYAGGDFYLRDPAGRFIRGLARWNGTDWAAVPGWNAGDVRALKVFDDDGDGPNRPALFVGAADYRATNAVPVNGIAKWDGRDWTNLGSGLTSHGLRGSAGGMHAFDEDDDPTTPAGLYVAGYFEYVGGVFTPRLARWGCPSPICFADCDESTGLGTLDIFDFLCFQNSFVNQDPYACDCDTTTGPGVCDLLDFLCFQSAFVTGCN